MLQMRKLIKSKKFVFFGPISSNNFPSGICIKANAKKYIEVIKPIWELVKKTLLLVELQLWR